MQPQYERLTDDQWEFIKLFVDYKRKRRLNLRDVFDTIFYVVRTGIQWRNLSQTHFPKWSAVYYYFAKWRDEGVFDQINLVANQLERLQIGRNALPSLGIADSQSVKLSPLMGQDRGIDGHKYVNGRNRHILVDTRGRLYACHVHAASGNDSTQGVYLLEHCVEFGERLQKILADKAYRGTFAAAVAEAGMEFEVPQRADGVKGFVLEAKRWVVERSLSWLNFFRRLSMDYERTPQSTRSFVILANITMVIWRIKFDEL